MGAPKLTRRFQRERERAKALRPQQTELQRLIARDGPGGKPSPELMAEVLRIVQEREASFGNEPSCTECGAREIDRGAPFTQHPGCPFA